MIFLDKYSSFLKRVFYGTYLIKKFEKSSDTSRIERYNQPHIPLNIDTIIDVKSTLPRRCTQGNPNLTINSYISSFKIVLVTLCSVVRYVFIYSVIYLGTNKSQMNSKVSSSIQCRIGSINFCEYFAKYVLYMKLTDVSTCKCPLFLPLFFYLVMFTMDFYLMVLRLTITRMRHGLDIIYTSITLLVLLEQIGLL